MIFFKHGSDAYRRDINVYDYLKKVKKNVLTKILGRGHHTSNMRSIAQALKKGHHYVKVT